MVGADGLHSRVRQLVFGPDAGGEVSLGYHVAAFEVEGYRLRDELVYVGYGVPGRQVFRFCHRALFFLVFRDEYLPAGCPANDRERKSALTQVFADVGWECPQVLAALASVGGIYFERVSQVRLDRWANGRTALDRAAPACVSLLAGQGSILAMAEAYVLAGELRHCGGDYAAAFAGYQERLMTWAKAQAEGGGEIRFVVCPEIFVGHCVPQAGLAADAAVAVGDRSLHRPRTAGSGPAPRLRVLTETWGRKRDILSEQAEPRFRLNQRDH